jgi:hypothetical protein
VDAADGEGDVVSGTEWRPGLPPLARYSPNPGAYLRAWRHAVAGGTVSFDEWRQRGEGRPEFLTALQRRITARGSSEPLWRKLDPSYQTELAHDAQELRDHAKTRRRLWGLNGRRWRTDVVQKRLGHLLGGYES